MSVSKKIAIIGGGNIGMSIARGLVYSEQYSAEHIIITRKKSDLPQNLHEDGFTYTDDNIYAVSQSEILIVAVLPQLAYTIFNEINSAITNRHSLISIVTGVGISEIEEHISQPICIARAMPNTAIKIRQSMTCIASNNQDCDDFKEVIELFNMLGKTLVIDESLISSATALGSCGIAFFLRSIRAASQGGTQIGFHAEDAQLIAAQTAKGAADLLLKLASHPEDEIDKVTTPHGITIAGLNEMEHNGFSSAFIKGIVKSYSQAIEKNK
ncbi:MAG: pyrroline-5-carboxylate reductase [Bacteroidales bacterium]